MSKVKLSYSKDRVEEAKEIRDRWYNHLPVERTPYLFTVTPQKTESWLPGCPYNFKETGSDSKKAVDGNILSIQHQFDTFPDCDYIPLMLLYYLGEGLLAAMYGADQVLDDNYPPFTKGRVYKNIYETQKMTVDIDIESTQWGRILKEHVTAFADATNGEIPIGMPDYQSPYGTATKLMDNEELMMAMYDEPELVHEFAGKVTDAIINLIHTMEKWLGRDLLAYNQTLPIPGKRGFMLCDDYISVLTPKLHTEFFAPYNLKLYEHFGYGHLHTCGPYFEGYLDACLACKPMSLDVTGMRGMSKKKSDMLKFLSITSENNIRLFGWLDTNENSIFERS